MPNVAVLYLVITQPDETKGWEVALWDRPPPPSPPPASTLAPTATTSGDTALPSAKTSFSPPDPTVCEQARQLVARACLDTLTDQTRLKEIGQMLYRCLLPGTVGQAFNSVWDASEHGLRLQLILPTAELQAIPWELIHDGAGTNEGSFLAQRPDFSLGRQINRLATDTRPYPRLSNPLALTRPLRLLVIVASPLNLQPNEVLEADLEVKLLERGLADFTQSAQLEIELQEQASLSRISRTLDEFQPHVVHFTGHGYYQPQSASEQAAGFGLVLEDELGQTLRVGAQTVAQTLAKCTTLQAVVLSACQTAIEEGDKAGFSGTAQALVRLGIPLVIAMQDRIRDDSATTFARHFYPALLRGEDAAAALSKARSELYMLDNNKSSDWAIPVLLTGAGTKPLLFQFGPQPAQPRPAAISNAALISSISKSDYFVGRRRERRLAWDCLARYDHPLPEQAHIGHSRVLLILGPGGYGKSTLARRSLERVTTRYRCIHVVRCQTWEGLSLVVMGLAQSLSQSGHPDLEGRMQPGVAGSLATATGGVLGQAVGHALSDGKGSMLVLDNFESLLEMETETDITSTSTSSTTNRPPQPRDPNLQAFLEGVLLGIDSGPGRLLITSRYDFSFTTADKHQSAIARVNLHKLDLPDAQRLFNTYPTLQKLSLGEQEDYWSKGLNTPQMIGWAAALSNTGQGEAMILRLYNYFQEDIFLADLYKRLNAASQTVLRRCAIYRKAVPIDLINGQVAGAGHDLGPLLGLGLVQRLETPEGLPVYEQHEAVRAFGRERLAEAEGPTGVAAAHRRAGKSYEVFADGVSQDLGDCLEAFHHYLEGAALDQAVGLVLALNPTLKLKGYWQIGLTLNAKLNQYFKDHPELVAAAEGDEEKDQLARADLLKNEAYFRRQLGEVAAAIPLYEKALGLVAGGSGAAGAILGNLGNAYQSLGDYHRAIELHTQALAISRAIGDKQAEGSILGNLGIAYQRLGDYHRAIEYALHASLILETIKSPVIQQTFNTLQKLYIRLGNAAFEGWATRACQQLGLDYTEYRQAVLELGGVFAPLQLTEYQQSLVKAFTLAAMGHTQALTDAHEWLETERNDNDWAKLVPQIERLLAGERQASVLLNPQLGLDQVDHTIIEAVLANLETASKSGHGHGKGVSATVRRWFGAIRDKRKPKG